VARCSGSSRSTRSTASSADAPIAITRGTLNSSLVHPREVFRAAIVAGAAAIIAVHNHPSGDPTPSEDDRIVTDMLVERGTAARHSGARSRHLRPGRYVSFAEAGFI
jgi:DNA repair protein RadC